MFSAVFRCFQLGCNFYRIAPCAMHNHPLCAHFVELPLCSGEYLAGLGCFCWKSNWTKFDHVGSTGGHWETISGSFSIPFGNGWEGPSQYPAVPRRRRLGRLQQRSPPTSSNLRREQGGSPVQINRQAGVGGAAQRHRQPVQTTPQHLHCSSPGPVPHFSCRCHLSPGKRGCSAERGDGEDGEATEGR